MDVAVRKSCILGLRFLYFSKRTPCHFSLNISNISKYFFLVAVSYNKLDIKCLWIIQFAGGNTDTLNCPSANTENLWCGSSRPQPPFAPLSKAQGPPLSTWCATCTCEARPWLGVSHPRRLFSPSPAFSHISSSRDPSLISSQTLEAWVALGTAFCGKYGFPGYKLWMLHI